MKAASMWQFSKAQLENSPSRRDGMPEHHIRAQSKAALYLLLETGKKLDVPQLTIATGMVFYHRFYAVHSLKKYNAKMVAIACLYLGCKVEETPKSVFQVLQHSYALDPKNAGQPGLRKDSRECWKRKEFVLRMERIVLQTLAFELSVKHPYPILLALIKRVQGSKQCAQIAWNFVNDSLKTTVCLQYGPATIAAAAIYLASRFVSMNTLTPDGQMWYACMDTPLAHLEDVSNQLLDFYDTDTTQSAMHTKLRDMRASRGSATSSAAGTPPAASTPPQARTARSTDEGVGAPLPTNAAAEPAAKTVPAVAPTPSRMEDTRPVLATMAKTDRAGKAAAANDVSPPGVGDETPPTLHDDGATSPPIRGRSVSPSGRSPGGSRPALGGGGGASTYASVRTYDGRAHDSGLSSAPTGAKESVMGSARFNPLG